MDQPISVVEYLKAETKEYWNSIPSSLADSDFIEAEEIFGVLLPADYKQFLRYSDGEDLDGLGENVEFLSLQDVIDFRQDAERWGTIDEEQYLPETMIVIGTDGSSQLFYFDPGNLIGNGHWAIYISMCPHSRENADYLAKNITQFVHYALNGDGNRPKLRTNAGALEVINAANATGATILDLSGAKLKTLPSQIGQLTNLTSLDLSWNELTALPEEIGQLVNLTQLKLQQNHLATFPDSMRFLINLADLNLSYNQFATLPKTTSQLSNLVKLDVDHNKLTTLPDDIGHLSNLQELSLNDNQLTTLPDTISQLCSLKHLSAWKNQFTVLPDAITFLPKLRWLELSYNQIDVLPQSISNLDTLEVLLIAHNQLVELPAIMANYTS
jgi:hypothetical protein